MYLLEHQAKELIRSAGIPVPTGEVAFTPKDVVQAAERIGPCVIKAQTKAGGRWKAGLIRPADSPEAAGGVAKEILGAVHEAETVTRVLVEERLDITREMYLGMILDFSKAHPIVLASFRGGVNIEEVAESDPNALVRMDIDPLEGVVPESRWGEFWRRVGLDEKLIPEAGAIAARLLELFYRTDALTLEVNPLTVTRLGSVIAADVKLIVDDAAMFRHEELRAYQGWEKEALEAEASEIGVTYVSLDPAGAVGIIAGGAGLSMATIDAIADAKLTPSAFLDLGGGISETGMAESIRIMLRTGNLEGILVNVFGGINNCEVLARGIARVYKDIGPEVSLVVKMRGHSQEEGWRILDELGIHVVKQGTTDDAVRVLVDKMSSKRRVSVN
ncbi:MAG: acetate--CoA ligase family protein [Deltaproteobacteria bacterium]|nr:MAG: acetate--CoA ligase family protein [Deltaproteobacteria bacterium]